MAFTRATLNRTGFFLLGLTNNFAYVIMLAAAKDLVSRTEKQKDPDKYCNAHSTATILLADTIPSLITKLLYPFFLVGVPTAYKAVATALFTAAAFITTGASSSFLLIYTGVSFASFSSGLGESTYLSNSPRYGDVALSGWSMGTGGAGLLGSGAYALMTIMLKIDPSTIMFIMLIVPVVMLLAYFYIIVPDPIETQQQTEPLSQSESHFQHPNVSNLESTLRQDISQTAHYGASTTSTAQSENPFRSVDSQLVQDKTIMSIRVRINYLPELSKYFMPLLLVYFAEYFINQGLFELIYYKEVSIDRLGQYRSFQVAYQAGVMLSRSSLDIMRIRSLWTMSILQSVNAVIFVVHVARVINIPSFYMVIVIIIYEGLLGGFTYANTFYRVQKELKPEWREFAISTVSIADTLGIVFAGMIAIPVHDELCKLYD